MNIDDFLILLGAWLNPCGPSDLNNDGSVDTVDFLVLLGNWGCGELSPEPFPADAQECIDRYMPDAARTAACIAALSLSGG